MASAEPVLPRTASDAARLAELTAQRLVVAGLVGAAAIAAVSSARLVAASSADLAWRSWLSGAILVGVSLLTVREKRRVVMLLAREDRWLMAWSALVVGCFALDGPGDELLLPAALGPLGVAGLMGRLGRALWCAAIIDVGYVALAIAEGPATWRGDGLHLAATNASFVVMWVVIIALPVRLGMATWRSAPAIVQQWRLDPGSPMASQIGTTHLRWSRRALPRGVSPAMLPLRASEGPLFTSQELRVLVQVRAGLGYKQIAIGEEQLLSRPCSKHRVRRIVAKIKRKVGVRTRNQLAALSLSEFGA